MKKNKGVLTIEASLVLTFSIMFMLFFLSFGRVYRAQNIVSHGVLQAADAISTESYIRENVSEEDLSDFLYVSNHIYGGESISGEALKSLKKVNFKKLAKDKFTAVVAEDTGKADAVLNSVGVKDGLAGVDFSRSKLDEKTGESIVFANYTVKLQFPLFGVKEIKMTKAAKVRNMGAESYLIEVRSANKAQGSTSGNTKVRKNGSTVISANPEWGYRFVKWQDGNTQNPRTISNVNSDKSFVAYFAKQGYGVKVNVKPSGAGRVAGVGTYELNDVVTLMPKENEGYLFDYWEDNGSKEKSRQVRVENDVTLTAVFKLAPSIKIDGGNPGTVIYERVLNATSSSVKSDYPKRPEDWIAEYSKTYTLKATQVGADDVSIKWSSSNPEIADVKGRGDQGVVTAKKSGTVTITASITVEGKTYKSEAEVVVKVFLQHYMFRKSNGVRYYHPEWVSYSSGGYASSKGWFYRLILVDDGDLTKPIDPGAYSKNIIQKAPGLYPNVVMHGYNASSKVAYCLYNNEWKDGDYIYCQKTDMPYVIQKVTIK